MRKVGGGCFLAISSRDRIDKKWVSIRLEVLTSDARGNHPDVLLLGKVKLSGLWA